MDERTVIITKTIEARLEVTVDDTLVESAMIEEAKVIATKTPNQYWDMTDTSLMSGEVR